MKNQSVKFLAIVSMMMLSSQAGIAQDANEKEADVFNSKAIEKLFMAHATPGEEHKLLHQMVGKWETKATDFTNPAAPVETKGTAVFESLLGGRFVQQKFSGLAHGQKFEGMGIMGYDNQQKKYLSIWVDSMGTGIMHMDGKYNEKTKTMTEKGHYESPVGKMLFRMETKYESEDKFGITMFMKMNPNAPEMKSMEIVYTRVK